MTALFSVIGVVIAQDTLAPGMSCYSDIVDDWKDQDNITATSDYRSAVSSILPTLVADDRIVLQSRFEALGSAAGNSAEMEQLYIRVCSARRAERMAAYIVLFPEVLFSEHPVLGDAYFFDRVPIANGINGRGLELLTMKGYFGSVSHLLPDGEARHPEVSFDGKRAVFSWRGGSSGSNDYHLYEIDLVTRVTRQLTFGTGEFSIDLDPCYLPNGDIVFVSSRFAQEIDCTQGRVLNLMLCDNNGNYMRQIGFDQVPILYPRLLNNGKVIYCRWDYNDKSHTYAHALFQMNPDGTAQREYCNNNSWWPTMILQPRPIPGSTKIMAMIGGYHTPQWGKIGIIDVNEGTQNGEGITLVAPVRLPKDDDLDTWGNPSGGPHPWAEEDAAVFPKPNAAPLDKWGQDPPLFAYPYPFDERAFLVSFRPASKESFWNGRMALYFMTVDGERELLYADREGSCMGAVPVVPREVPMVLPGTVDYRDSMGTFQIMKINVGQSLQGVADGVIKRLRIAELYFRPGPVVDGASAYQHCGPGCINFGGATYHTAIATPNASWDAKWIVGEVPVESDGSANFRAPARVPLFFQALNAKGQVVQTMRSWTTLQPGEVFSCMGCHESSLDAPPLLTYVPIALQKEPREIEPFYGPRRGFSFDNEIQPIFDEKCIDCHDGGANSGGLDLRQGKAYANLTQHTSCAAFSKYVSWFHAEESPVLQPPYRAGSCRSLLDSILDKGNEETVMADVTDEEMRKIRCWIDLGVPLWGTYEEGHPGSERNLSYRNTWIAQEKKNIAEYLKNSWISISKDMGDEKEVSVRGEKAWEVTPVCAVNRSGTLRIRLGVSFYADGKVVGIKLYNIKGELTDISLAVRMSAGTTTVALPTKGLSAGQYIVEVRSQEVRKTVMVPVLQ